MNIHENSQTIAKDIIELKKKRRNLDREIRAKEKKLSGIFDDKKIDELELDIGVLVRRKTESGYEWMIEI